MLPTGLHKGQESKSSGASYAVGAPPAPFIDCCSKKQKPQQIPNQERSTCMFEAIASAVEAATPVAATTTEPTAAHLLPNYTSSATGQTVPNHGYAPEATAEQVAASKDQRIAELEAALAEHAKQTHKSPVLLPDGEQLPLKQARMELEDMSLEAQLEIRKAQRFVQELAEQQDAYLAQQPISAKPSLLTRESAELLMGKDAWKALPNAAKAAALDIRQADVDKLKVEDHFGPNTSRAAHELSKANPALYALLRGKAVQKGIIAERGTSVVPKSTIRAFGV